MHYSTDTCCRNRVGLIGCVLIAVVFCLVSCQPERPSEYAPTAPGPAPAATTLEKLIDAAQTGGWHIEGEVRFYPGKALTEMIDGAAERFFNYVFEGAARAELAHEDFPETIQVDIYEMGNSADAFGAYTMFLGEGESPAVGTDAVLTEPLLRFWKDRYYVDIAYYGSFDEAARTEVERIGRAVASGIAQSGEWPEAVRALTVEGLIPTSISFLHNTGSLAIGRYAHLSSELTSGNPLRLSDRTDMAIAQYSVQGTAEEPPPYIVFVVKYPDAAAASKVFDAGEVENLIVLEDAYVIGFMGPRNDQIEGLIEDVHDQIKAAAPQGS